MRDHFCSKTFSATLLTVALFVIGKCQSKTIPDNLAIDQENNLSREDSPLDLSVARPRETASDGDRLNATDFTNAAAVRDELEPYGNSWTRNTTSVQEFFEGDIAGIPAQDVFPTSSISSDMKGLVQNNAVNEAEKRWTGGVVPYVISTTFISEERSLIAKAMMEYHNKTCLRFTPRKAFHRDYLNIVKADGCYSAVGRQGGPQTVSLGAGCFQLGTIIHELMHAVGFWHEHSRSDRDDHIFIRWENIQPGMEHNFGKLDLGEAQNLGTPYDLNSVMHYGPYAFAKDDYSPTIFPKTRATFGKRNRLSKIDSIKIDRLYECTPSKDPTTTPSTVRIVSTSPSMTVSSAGMRCSNFHRFCSQWAEDGECSYNPEYMRVACPKSCGYCQFRAANTNACEDDHRYCRAWAERGQCRLNPDFMLSHCRKSCGECY